MMLNDIFEKIDKHTVFLVTGGAGFIGSNIAEKLIEHGFSVRVLDNFSTGKISNIIELQKSNKFKLIEGTILDVETCQKACLGVDYVLHQAAFGSVPRSIKDPEATNEVNISGTLNMLLSARDANVKAFVYASSSAVYGDEPNLPKREDRVGVPLSPYAITKKVDELYAHLFYSLYGLKTIGLRYFNVFGKRQDPHSAYAAVIPIFIRNNLNNEVSVIDGDGNQSRDFTYVDNVVKANLLACLAGKKAYGEVFNIAYGGRITLNHLYGEIGKLMNKVIMPSYGPQRLGDVKHSNADISKATELLGYTPEIDFTEGLRLSIDWYRENIER